jgi:hypothetical protein
VAILVSGVPVLVLADQPAPPSRIEVDRAVRAKTIIDEQNRPGTCSHVGDSDRSCLFVKVSGIKPDALAALWAKNTDSIYVAVGEAKESIGVVRLQGGPLTVLELSVPKAATEFVLVVGDYRPVTFTAPVTPLAQLKLNDLFAAAKPAPKK